jgi:hypothetical protein
VAFLVSLAALGAAAGSAAASQPVTVDFTAFGTATVNAQMSPGDCNNGAAIYATMTDVIPFHWDTKFNTTINNDDTIVDEPGYLVSHDFGNQTANVVGSGGDGSPACNQAIAMSIQPCPLDVQADAVGGANPRLSDPDRAAQQLGPVSYENVDVQGPVSIINPNPSPSIGCGLGFNDLTMLNASLPNMFTAHIQLPHDIFFDPKTGETRDSWSTDVSMRDGPIDGSACIDGNNGVAYLYCNKNVSWSGTVTITPRADDCSEGATEPPLDSKCPPVKPVVPFAKATAVNGPTGSAATTGGALTSGSVPVTVSVSGPGAVSGSMSASTGGGGAHDAAVRRIVIASGRAAAHKAGRITLRLKLTNAGRKLLRSWRRRTLLTKLAITVTSAGGHRATITRTIKLRRTAANKIKR